MTKHKKAGTRLAVEKTSQIRWLLIFWLFVLSAVALSRRVNISIAGGLLATISSVQKFTRLDLQALFLSGYALFQTPWRQASRPKLGARGFLALGVFVVGASFNRSDAAVPSGLQFCAECIICVRFALGAGKRSFIPPPIIVSRWIPSRAR